MKKLLYAIIALSLLTGSVAAVRANNDGDGREKISSPSEIHNYRDIIKHGNDLFGFRIAFLEKIHAMAEIGNFENIRKMGGSLWGYRKISGSAMVTAQQRSCVSAAITKKDTALKRALNSFSSSTSAAIDARTNCQLKAISLASASEQQSANMSCTATYKASAKTNLKTLVNTRNDAWKNYKNEIKTCGSANAEIKLEDGGNLENAL